MASSADISKYFLECGLCSGDYKNAKLLPCAHFFCERCLMGYAAEIGKQQEGNKVPNTFPCPTCRFECETPSNGIPGLFNIHFAEHLKGFIDQEEASENEENYELKVCENCDLKSAHLMCDQCDSALCNGCREKHDAFKVMQNHTVDTIKAIRRKRSQSKSSEPAFCDKHPDQPLKFYCPGEVDPICFSCKLTSHERHQSTDIKDACGESLDELATLITDTEKHLTALQATKQDVIKQEEKCSGLKRAAQGAARTQADLLIKAVENAYQQTISEIEAHFSSEQSQIDAHKEQLDMCIASTENHRQLAQQLVLYGRADQIISINKHLQETIQQAKPTVAIDDNDIFWLEFLHKKVSVDDVLKMFGEVNTVKPELRTPARYYTIKSTHTTNAKIKDDDWGCNPVGLAVVHVDNVVVSDYNNKNVKRFDSHGNLVNLLNPDPEHPIIQPRDLCVIDNDKIAVADSGAGDIKLFSVDGEFIRTVLEKMDKPRGLAVNSKGHMIVSDDGTRKVYLFDRDEELLQVLPHEFRCPHYITVNTINDNIIVSDSSAHCINVFNSSGTELLFTYGVWGTGENQLDCPWKVCTDRHGNIFIADSCNDRIHLLGADGKFAHFVATRDNRLWSPHVIALNGHGDLVIGQDEGEVITIKFD